MGGSCDNRRMEIMNHTVAALTWTLKDSLGEMLDELTEPLEFLIGSGDLLPKIEEALMGKKEGDTVSLYLQPEDAFGDYDENLVFLEARDLFPPEIEEGMVFEGGSLPADTSPDIPVDVFLSVTELYPEHVVLDANHPLAGIALQIDLKVASVRPSTEEERQRGTVGIGFFKLQPDDGQPPTLH